MITQGIFLGVITFLALIFIYFKLHHRIKKFIIGHVLFTDLTTSVLIYILFMRASGSVIALTTSATVCLLISLSLWSKSVTKTSQ